MLLLYNLLITLLSPIWVPWMMLRARRRGEQPNWKERCGDYPIEPSKTARRIWVHAVSVGEVLAAMPILQALRGKLPQYEIVLSVTTSSGHQTARERAAALFDHLVYFPIDVPRFQLAAMLRVKPEVVAIMETELWMNFLWAAKTVDAKTMLINGRISDRSYPRSRRLKFFYRALLRDLDEALMQTETDADRIRDLGARNVAVVGNCKFDEAAKGVDVDPTAVRADLGIPADAFVVVVGSTRSEAEERFVLDALSPLAGDLWVVHAPRHLERAPDLAQAVAARLGSVALRSKGESGRYLILDTYGDLGRAYLAGDVAIVGGGFGNFGGQNLIQPLAAGNPVLHGVHMQNFAEATRLALAAGASVACSTPEALREALVALRDDAGTRRRMGEAARRVVEAHVGASERYADAIVGATRPS